MATYSTTSGGACKPTNQISLLAFKIVQQQANRFLDVQGKSLITCDGIIGSQTLAAVNSVSNVFPTTGLLGSPATSCAQVAGNASGYATAMKSIADAHELALPECPKGIIRSITNPEPKVSSNGEVSYPVNSSLMTAGFAGVPLWAIALIGVGGYVYYKKSKSKS